MKKKLVVSLATGMFMFGLAGMADATSIQTTITADNHYALYAGNQSGVSYIGRNELSGSGSSGSNNWSVAETFNFNMTSGDYIYIAGWSDDSVAQGLLGQFVVDNSSTILTNITDWEVYLTFNDLDDGSPAPTTTDMLPYINNASWKSVTDYIDHGSGPWGTISGIDTNADWIWGSALLPGSNYGEFQIFRTRVGAPVPEPATMLLLGAGLAGLAGSRLRRKKN